MVVIKSTESVANLGTKHITASNYIVNDTEDAKNIEGELIIDNNNASIITKISINNEQIYYNSFNNSEISPYQDTLNKKLMEVVEAIKFCVFLYATNSRKDMNLCQINIDETIGYTVDVYGVDNAREYIQNMNYTYRK